MALLPEIILRSVLIQGIKDARRDDETLDILFRNTSREIVDSLKAAFKEMKVKVVLNYPRQDIQLPCIAILLRGEDESEPLLGDLIGEGYSPGTIDGLAQAGTDARGTSGSKIRPEHFFTADETADVSDSPLSNPTSTIIGEPRRLFVDDGETLYKREGVGDEASYLVHILASKPEITIFLYCLCKYIFRKNRMTLERNGLVQFTLSGTDFAPQPTHLPTYTYSRALSCRFLYWFDWFLIEGKDGSLGYGEGIAKGMDITLYSQEGEDPFTVTEVDVLSQLPVIETVTPNSVSVSVQATLIFSGTNFHNVGTVQFPQLPIGPGPTGIEIISVEYIHDNDLRVIILPHSTGTTDVTVVQPDLLSTTLTDGLTVV